MVVHPNQQWGLETSGRARKDMVGVRQARTGKEYHIAVMAVWPWMSEKKKGSAQEMLASRLTPCLSWLALLYRLVGSGVRDVMVDTLSMGTCWLGSGELDNATVNDASVSKKKKTGRTQRRRRRRVGQHPVGRWVSEPMVVQVRRCCGDLEKFQYLLIQSVHTTATPHR